MSVRFGLISDPRFRAPHACAASELRPGTVPQTLIPNLSTTRIPSFGIQKAEGALPSVPAFRMARDFDSFVRSGRITVRSIFRKSVLAPVESGAFSCFSGA